MNHTLCPSRWRPPLLLLVLSFALALSGCVPGPSVEEPAYDVVIYGGTSAGISAAVQAARMGKSVVVVGPDGHLGGLSSGGLGWTDSGRKEIIGGIAREFYHRVYEHYQTPDAWTWQKAEDYGNRGQGTPAIDGNAGRGGSSSPTSQSRSSTIWSPNTTSPFIAMSGSTARAASRRRTAESAPSPCSAAGGTRVASSSTPPTRGT